MTGSFEEEYGDSLERFARCGWSSAIGEALGRIDIHSEKPFWPDFPRLVIAFFARCAASRLKKRLDP